jgi:serine/threonine-protein kinase RsbW
LTAPSPVVELEIPARTEFVALARLVVSSFAYSSAGLAEDRIDDLKLAVSEACTNAIEAHDDIRTDERVLIRCGGVESTLEVEVEDRGNGFDAHRVSQAPPLADPDRLTFERGLGIPLIRALADEVDFSSTDGGTTVRIVMNVGPEAGEGN